MKKQKKWISIMVLTAFLFSIVNVPVLAAEVDSALQTAEQSQAVAVSETEKNTESIEALTDGSETITGNTKEKTETVVEETETIETVDDNIQQISTEVESTAADTAVTSGTCGENVTWELVDGVLTISGNGEMEDYKDIGDSPWCVDDCSIQTIIIKNGVTGIGNYAFSYCDITSIEIPSSVTSIGEKAFYHCEVLENVTLLDGVKYIYAEAFSQCDSLKNVIIQGSVDSIGSYSFSNCDSLTNVTITGSVNSIGYRSFYSCGNLSKVNIVGDVVNIGDYAFYKCSNLENFEITGKLNSIGDYAFFECENLKDITLPDGVSNIGKWAFYYCGSFINVTIPGSVSFIGEGSFSYCYSLKSVNILEGVHNIGSSAFNHCVNLENVVLPDGIVSIDSEAFEDCIKLQNVNFPDSIIRVGQYAFSNCDSIKSITFPNNITSLDACTFYDCDGLISVMIPKNVTIIGARVFYSCDALENVTIADGVKQIRNEVFKDCKNLNTVKLSDSITVIGDGVFCNCNSLLNIIIPNNITEIGNGVFDGCNNLSIHGTIGSMAETYATNNNIPFVAISGNVIGSNGTVLSLANPIYHCAVGGLTRVSASVIYPNGEPEVETFSWSVSDTDVVDMVTVLPTAFQPEANVKWIEGLQPGECTITVRTSDGAVSTAVIKVTENISEVEAQQQFVDQHLAFKNGSVYEDRMTYGRWGQILDDAQDTAVGNTAEVVYHIINSTSEMLSCQALSVFKSPYDVILGDLVLKQKDFEHDYINRTYEILDEYVSMLVEFCELNGESVDAEFRLNLEKLILDPKSVKETNEGFYRGCNDLFGKYVGDSDLEKILNRCGKASAIWGLVGDVGKAVEWVVHCVNFNAQMEAFLETSDIYKEMLMSASYFIPDAVYCNWYVESLERYFEYMNEEKQTEILFKEFVSSGMNRAAGTYGSTITKGLIGYGTGVLGLSAAAPWIVAVTEAIDKGWAIGDAVTGVGSIIDCRELIRANSYLENAMYQLTEHYAYALETRQDYMSALHYDQAYTLLKETEIYSLNTYNEFLDRQQSGFVQSILHGFRPYNAAEIEQGVILIAQWENANCHVASKNFEDLEVQQLSYATLGLPARTVASGTENAEVNVDIGTIKLSESCNVYIHDKTGKLLYSIENGEVTCDSKGINGSITEGVIVIADCDIENHIITFEATKDGAVDYVLTTYDENADMTQTTAYEQLPVKENSVYVSDYDNSTNEVSLTDSQGEPLIADVKTNTLIPIETVELTVQKEKLEIGEITSAQVVVKPSDATCKMGAWSSSDELIATVDGEGKITAIAEGTVTIRWTATDGSGVEKSVVITVNNGKTAQVKTTSMYRLYNPNSGEHFYTGSIEERDMLVNVGWQYEGVAWNAPTQTGDSVYRLFNPNNGDHHYTMSAEERDNLVAVGWRYEGVCWNSASPENLPLYRLYNPNADCGSHHYTGSTEERDFLVSLGWHFEGIGWFGMLN